MPIAGIYFDYANAGIFLLLGAVFVIANVSLVNRLIRPRVPEETKETTYECGEPAVGTAWVRFDMRFYTVALIFLIFDVEVAFLYPWGIVFRRLASGSRFVFLEAFVFLAVLGVGLVYVWAKGDLDWIKSTSAQRPRSPGEEAPPPEEEQGEPTPMGGSLTPIPSPEGRGEPAGKGSHIA